METFQPTAYLFIKSTKNVAIDNESFIVAHRISPCPRHSVNIRGAKITPPLQPPWPGNSQCSCVFCCFCWGDKSKCDGQSRVEAGVVSDDSQVAPKKTSYTFESKLRVSLCLTTSHHHQHHQGAQMAQWDPCVHVPAFQTSSHPRWVLVLSDVQTRDSRSYSVDYRGRIFHTKPCTHMSSESFTVPITWLLVASMEWSCWDVCIWCARQLPVGASRIRIYHHCLPISACESRQHAARSLPVPVFRTLLWKTSMMVSL